MTTNFPAFFNAQRTWGCKAMPALAAAGLMASVELNNGTSLAAKSSHGGSWFPSGMGKKMGLRDTYINICAYRYVYVYVKGTSMMTGSLKSKRIHRNNMSKLMSSKKCIIYKYRYNKYIYKQIICTYMYIIIYKYHRYRFRWILQTICDFEKILGPSARILVFGSLNKNHWISRALNIWFKKQKKQGALDLQQMSAHMIVYRLYSAGNYMYWQFLCTILEDLIVTHPDSFHKFSLRGHMGGYGIGSGQEVWQTQHPESQGHSQSYHNWIQLFKSYSKPFIRN